MSELPSFEDSRVQEVYKILVDDESVPNAEEHWEGWAARRIVAKLFDVKNSREVKNSLCIDGHLNAALDYILSSNEPDAIFAVLTQLAHRAVDMSFTALGQGASNEQSI